MGSGFIGSPADRSAMRSDREQTLEAEIARLDGLGLQELRQVWRQRLGPPPQHISTELTRRRLAYELQVKVYGDLKPETHRRLKQFYKAFKADPHHTPSSVSVSSRVLCSPENGTAPNTVSRSRTRASSIATSNTGH